MRFSIACFYFGKTPLPVQGTGTAADVMKAIKAQGKEAEFPLFSKIHGIAFENHDPKSIVEIN